MINRPDLHWEGRNAGGWEYLLPLAARRRWLCIDVNRGATALLLAGLCDELFVIPADRAESAEIAEQLRAEGVDNARVAAHGDYREAVAHRGDGFDGFILHDLGGVLSREAVEEALRTAAQLVAPDGFIYAALRNRFGYTRMRRSWSGIRQGRNGAYFSPSAVRQLVGGGRETVLHPLISDKEGRVLEVVPSNGYVSAKNPSLPNEVVRRWLLGKRGAPRWSPAFAVLASGDPKARSGLACALDTLKAHGCLNAPIDPASLVKRYHVLHGRKAIISVGETPGKYGSHIVVLVRWPEFTARRRRESEVLSRLGKLPADIAGRIPRFYFEEEVGDAHVFVLQEFPGITLDVPTAGLRQATRDGAQFLMQLHSTTRRTLPLTPASFQTMFGTALRTARDRYPVLVSVLNRMEAALQQSLAGMELPVVWMHGDYKIENIVVDETTYRLLGVIDWEHSEPEGLPLLDLWYLLLYNRQIEHGVDFLAAVQDVLLPQNFTEEEAGFCSEYMRALDIPSQLVPALAGALILHHIGRRMEYHSGSTKLMDRLRTLLERSVALIDGASAPSRAGAWNGEVQSA